MRETARSLRFYTEVLGMKDQSADKVFAAGYRGADADLVFEAGATKPAALRPTDAYWKIGITVANLDHAVRWLDSQNWPVSRPRQFRDIGYLCHLQDPDGLTIELLQHGFEGNAGPEPVGHAIGAQATVAHLTLRANDLSLARDYSTQDLGLTLMSVQPVADFGFTLYFFGPGQDSLPADDLTSVASREWLWQRPYTLLELQHLEQKTELTQAEADEAGFIGFEITEGETASFQSLAELPPL